MKNEMKNENLKILIDEVDSNSMFLFKFQRLISTRDIFNLKSFIPISFDKIPDTLLCN